MFSLLAFVSAFHVFTVFFASYLCMAVVLTATIALLCIKFSYCILLKNRNELYAMDTIVFNKFKFTELSLKVSYFLYVQVFFFQNLF